MHISITTPIHRTIRSLRHMNEPLHHEYWIHRLIDFHLVDGTRHCTMHILNRFWRKWLFKSALLASIDSRAMQVAMVCAVSVCVLNSIRLWILLYLRPHPPTSPPAVYLCGCVCVCAHKLHFAVHTIWIVARKYRICWTRCATHRWQHKT